MLEPISFKNVSLYGNAMPLRKAEENPVLFPAKFENFKLSEPKPQVESVDFEKTLTEYGLDAKSAQAVGIQSCEVKEINGVTTLILKAPQEGYVLELPIDDNYNPSEIEMYSYDGEFIGFKNINGTLRFDKRSFNSSKPRELRIADNSNVTVYGVDGQKDSVTIFGDTRLTFITNDNKDVIEAGWGENSYRLNLQQKDSGTTFDVESVSEIGEAY